mgnify:CR=1 FL=1
MADRLVSQKRSSDSPPKPPWVRVRLPSGETYAQLRQLIRGKHLHTVCEAALCPNIAECWGRGTATFMILGDVCTRNCRFCAVRHGVPVNTGERSGEPLQVARAVAAMGLRHAVVTSVTRDDLPDGGAKVFAETISWLRQLNPTGAIEVLTPDFGGNWEALRTVVVAAPDIFGHNMETVPRLYPAARPEALYQRSLQALERAHVLNPSCPTKSGLMLGMGESQEEILAVMCDLRRVGCDILTLGQYLRPTRAHLPVARYYTPEEFAALAEAGRRMGFAHVESGPLVRSSYHADAQARDSRRGAGEVAARPDISCTPVGEDTPPANKP